MFPARYFIVYSPLAALLAIGSLAGMPRTVTAGPLKFQSFDSEAAAAADGWVEVNTSGGTGQTNYGFSNTNFAGGLPGEAGGTFNRDDIGPGYYADVNLGGTLDRNDHIQASGLLDITNISAAFNGGFFAAHFNTSVPGGVGAIGLVVLELSTSSVRARAAIQFSDGSFYSGGNIVLTGFPNIDRNWSYVFDPSGGADGVGRLELTIDGPGGGTSVVELTNADAGKNFALDAFGIIDASGSGAPQPGNTITAYIDNVAYTAVVPEPASYVLAAFGAVFTGMLLRTSRQRRN